MSSREEAAVTAGGMALWRGTALRADARHSESGAPEYLWWAICHGVRDMHSVPFTEGTVFREIPPTEENLSFGREALRKGCEERMYERKSA